MGSRNAALPRALFFGKWVGRGPRACTSTPRTKTCPRGAPDLGLSFDARFAGWMVGPGRGFAACFVFRNWADLEFVGLKPPAPSV